jgi:hypothetical protein
MNYIERANELFGIELSDQCLFRFFPDGENASFAHLETMESRHRTYWDLTHKVKIYTASYGRELCRNMQTLKNNGAPYLNKYWIDFAEDGNEFFFHYHMVPGKDMLFDLIDDFSVDRAVLFIRAAYDNIENNMMATIGDKFLIAHDYKLFNIIEYGGDVMCFDYDRFSLVDSPLMLYEEFWHKVAIDDLGAATLNIAPDVQKQILDVFQDERNDRISKLSL